MTPHVQTQPLKRPLDPPDADPRETKTKKSRVEEGEAAATLPRRSSRVSKPVVKYVDEFKVFEHFAESDDDEECSEGVDCSDSDDDDINGDGGPDVEEIDPDWATEEGDGLDDEEDEDVGDTDDGGEDEEDDDCSSLSSSSASPSSSSSSSSEEEEEVELEIVDISHRPQCEQLKMIEEEELIHAKTFIVDSEDEDEDEDESEDWSDDD